MPCHGWQETWFCGHTACQPTLPLLPHLPAPLQVLLTPSGTDAVTASTDGTARVWDLDIGDCVLLLEGHAGPINDMAITSGGCHRRRRRRRRCCC